MTKTLRRQLLRKVKRLLTARSNGKVLEEQRAYEALSDYCEPFGVDPGDAIEQGIEFLKRTSIAASMNGIV